jgi:hypothetical protein
MDLEVVISQSILKSASQWCAHHEVVLDQGFVGVGPDAKGAVMNI